MKVPKDNLPLLGLGVSVLALALTLCGCSGSDKPEATPKSVSKSAEPEPGPSSAASGSGSGSTNASGPKLSLEERLDPANTGSIRGVVRFDGAAPLRTELASPVKTPGCKHHETPPLSEVVIVNDGKLQNVFAYIREKGLPRGWELPESPPTVKLDQAGCIYVPHVQGMTVGQTLMVHNSDKLAHNVNCRANRNPSINPTQGMGAAPVEWKPARKEVMVKFECNIHNWMWSYVGVLEHPYFAVSGADGSFVIEGLPPGNYELEAWHEKFGKQKLEVTVPKGKAAEVELTYKP